ncbi:MAG: hypothetical protein JSU91_02820 [Thermoplasmatales archaeon]|nr:MAG: hypothetical protein JSU91_02820 [Thermoplasmatales archaeon]
MIKSIRVWIRNKFYTKSLNRITTNRFIMLISISTVLLISFSIINNQSASAYPPYTSYCDSCHQDDSPNTSISVTEFNQTENDITYYVTGSDNYDGEEGWAVFNPSMTNVDNGDNSGYFTLQKDGQTYRVYWVDNGPNRGGSAYIDITTPAGNNPPNKPTIDGPTSGNAGTSYEYTFTATDPDGDDIKYYIKWGDGEITDWTVFQASGTTYSENHTWESEGTFTIEAKTMDQNDAESDWESFEVFIPRSRVYDKYNLFERLFERFPLLIKLLNLLIQN